MSEWQKVARECGTDKGTHTYMPVYEKFLGPLTAKDFQLSILEIGVGNGESLRMWLKLFPTAHVYGLDYRNCCPFSDPRLTVFRRFQQDPGIASLFAPEYLDIIVDDGGHHREWQRASVSILWPALKTGGHYFIEDILTDSWPEEVGRWRVDPNCVHAEENRKDVFGDYCRSDALVVLNKSGDRAPHPLAEDGRLDHWLWPIFFHHMESLADPPFTGRFDSQGGAYWDWLERPDFWIPVWDRFVEGQIGGGKWPC